MAGDIEALFVGSFSGDPAGTLRACGLVATEVPAIADEHRLIGLVVVSDAKCYRATWSDLGVAAAVFVLDERGLRLMAGDFGPTRLASQARAGERLARFLLRGEWRDHRTLRPVDPPAVAPELSQVELG